MHLSWEQFLILNWGSCTWIMRASHSQLVLTKFSEGCLLTKCKSGSEFWCSPHRLVKSLTCWSDWSAQLSLIFTRLRHIRSTHPSALPSRCGNNWDRLWLAALAGVATGGRGPTYELKGLFPLWPTFTVWTSVLASGGRAGRSRNLFSASHLVWPPPPGCPATPPRWWRPPPPAAPPSQPSPSLQPVLLSPWLSQNWTPAVWSDLLFSTSSPGRLWPPFLFVVFWYVLL